MFHAKKAITNSVGSVAEMDLKTILAHARFQKVTNRDKKCTERAVEKEESDLDCITEQEDELGCGEALALEIDLNLMESLEEAEACKSEKESVNLNSDSWGSRSPLDYNNVAEQMQFKIGEITNNTGAELIKNGVSASPQTPSSSVQFFNRVYRQCRADAMLTDTLFYSQICTETDSFYTNCAVTGRKYSNDEDADGMFSDICDAGEALADKDGLFEDDLFEETESPETTDGDDSVVEDIVMLTIEGSNSSGMSSLSIDEEDSEMQMDEFSPKTSVQDFPVASSGPEPSTLKSDCQNQNIPQITPGADAGDANHNNCNEGDVMSQHPENELFTQSVIPERDESLSLELINTSLIPPETTAQSLSHNQQVEQAPKIDSDLKAPELTCSMEDQLYENTEAKDFLQNRKNFMTRSISVETPIQRVDLMCGSAGNGRLLQNPCSYYVEQCCEDRPVLTGSLGCLSQGAHTFSKVGRLQIPPPFELASITKRPIRKSSPSLTNEISASCKKTDFGFMRYFLPLRFLKKSDRKSTLDNRSTFSRSSSESSPQASCRRSDFIRHNMGSPDFHRTLECTPHLPHASFLSPINKPKNGLDLSLNKDFTSSTVSMKPAYSVHSLLDPLPLSKPRSFSSPIGDSSDYENVQNASSHYENVQIRLLNPVIQSQRNQSSSSDMDGYVDMSSLPGFKGKGQASEQETESLYTFCSPNVRPDKTVGISVEACTSENATSEKMTINCSRAFYSAKELLDSEAQHVDSLQHLCQSLEADERLVKMWIEVPGILLFHQDIHTLLEARIREWNQKEGIAEIILTKKTEFYIFSSYISHYDEKVNHLELIQNTINDVTNLRKRLLQVIVRVLQYHMLLTDYLNNLSPHSREFKKTQDALVVVSDVAHHANDTLKNGANLLRLANIEHNVLGLTDLLQPGRVFVKEGTLMKVSRKSKQPRHLFLMNDILLYTYPQQDGKYRLINTLPLAEMQVSKQPIENAQNALKIEVKDTNITLSASSCSERDGWFTTLNKTLLEWLGPSSREPEERLVMEGPEMFLGENAPPLLSVSQVTVCMNCPALFSLTNRRHHCHACGKVVCRDCSRNKIPLKYKKNRRAKVCDPCYAELRKNDLAAVTESSSRPLSAVFQNIHPSSLWKSRKGQMSFNQVTGSEWVMSGSLQRCKNTKRSWKNLWFLLKDKVLYAYSQPEERVACETLPLLGFSVRSEVEGERSVFQLYHKSTLFYTFRAQDGNTAQRWVNAMEEATVL